jgi:GNAT superfamily N-acetyltransferase
MAASHAHCKYRPWVEAALALLRNAAIEIRPLYGEAPGSLWPTNPTLGPRDLYVAAFMNETAMGCGAIRELDAVMCKLHRMYVLLSHRRQGLARAILSHLHGEARRLGYLRMRLEKRQSSDASDQPV